MPKEYIHCKRVSATEMIRADKRVPQLIVGRCPDDYYRVRGEEVNYTPLQMTPKEFTYDKVFRMHCCGNLEVLTLSGVKLEETVVVNVPTDIQVGTIYAFPEDFISGCCVSDKVDAGVYYCALTQGDGRLRDMPAQGTAFDFTHMPDNLVNKSEVWCCANENFGQYGSIVSANYFDNTNLVEVTVTDGKTAGGIVVSLNNISKSVASYSIGIPAAMLDSLKPNSVIYVTQSNVLDVRIKKGLPARIWSSLCLGNVAIDISFDYLPYRDSMSIENARIEQIGVSPTVRHYTWDSGLNKFVCENYPVSILYNIPLKIAGKVYTIPVPRDIPEDGSACLLVSVSPLLEFIKERMPASMYADAVSSDSVDEACLRFLRNII